MKFKVKILIIIGSILLLTSGCAKDREFVKDLYFSYKMHEDLEKNRSLLYRDDRSLRLDGEEYY